jgi:hypothetical protein
VTEGSPLRRALIVYAAVTAGLVVLQYQPWGWLRGHVGTAAAVLFLYVPIWMADAAREPLGTVGLTLERWREDLAAAGIAALVTFPPYIVAYHLWAVGYWGGRPGFAVPDDVWTLVPTHLLLVALPEETFYRGLLQRDLDRHFGTPRRVLGVPLGWGTFWCGVLFAVGHVVLTPRPDRLSVFFPSLLFSWLRARTGTVIGATVYHAASNVLARFLFVSYGLGQ